MNQNQTTGRQQAEPRIKPAEPPGSGSNLVWTELNFQFLSVLQNSGKWHRKVHKGYTTWKQQHIFDASHLHVQSNRRRWTEDNHSEQIFLEALKAD